MSEALQHELDQVLADFDDANKRGNILDDTNFNLRQQIENISVNSIAQLKADLETINHQIDVFEQENFELRQQLVPVTIHEELDAAKKKVSVIQAEFETIKEKHARK
jgi:hypothetical protein